MKITDMAMLQARRAAGLAKLAPDTRVRIAVGMGTCGMGTGAADVYQAFAHELDRQQLPALLTQTGCFGCCAQEPLVNLRLPGQPLVIRKGEAQVRKAEGGRRRAKEPEI